MLVCFNGQKAGESEERLRSLGYVTLVFAVVQRRKSKESRGDDFAVGTQFVNIMRHVCVEVICSKMACSFVNPYTIR